MLQVIEKKFPIRVLAKKCMPDPLFPEFDWEKYSKATRPSNDPTAKPARIAIYLVISRD